MVQQFRSMLAKNPFVPTVYKCPYKYKCNCNVAFTVNIYMNKVEMAVAGKHTTARHIACSGDVSVKQRNPIKSAARAAPQAVGSQVDSSCFSHRMEKERLPKVLRQIGDL